MTKTILENFTEPLDKRWIQTCIGDGKLYYENSKLRMAFESAQQGQYTDAQIDDYGNLKKIRLSLATSNTHEGYCSFIVTCRDSQEQ